MQGMWINGLRPKSKKAVKDAYKNGDDIVFEATSVFGNEYDGPMADAPDGPYSFVLPDPYKDRRHYLTIDKKGDRITINGQTGTWQ